MPDDNKAARVRQALANKAANRRKVENHLQAKQLGLTYAEWENIYWS